MPKKFRGENTKAVEARSRKAAAKTAEKERVEKAREDEYWRDDDKNVERKTQRKEEKAAKREEELARKRQLKALADAELKEAGAVVNDRQVVNKVTHAQLAAHREKVEMEKRIQEQQEEEARKKIVVQDDSEPLAENVNRMKIEGDEARSVTEAIHVLNDSVPTPDKHPEKRMRAAYANYEQKRLPQLKAENPSMRLGQLRHMLHKEWQKAPENPMNQAKLLSQGGGGTARSSEEGDE